MNSRAQRRVSGSAPKPVWERNFSISASSNSNALAARGWDARRIRPMSRALSREVRAGYEKRLRKGLVPGSFLIPVTPTRSQEASGTLRPIGFDPASVEDKRAIEVALGMAPASTGVLASYNAYGVPKTIRGGAEAVTWAYALCSLT